MVHPAGTASVAFGEIGIKYLIHFPNLWFTVQIDKLELDRMSNHFLKIFRRAATKPDVVGLKDFDDLYREMTDVMEQIRDAEKRYADVMAALHAMVDAIAAREVKS